MAKHEGIKGIRLEIGGCYHQLIFLHIGNGESDALVQFAFYTVVDTTFGYKSGKLMKLGSTTRKVMSVR